jgi:eukaryotic-like serine/threonine-protein kinase
VDPSVEGTPERIGAYRVVRRLAMGGTSDVLLARAEGPHGFERTVVLKLLLAQFREDPSFERMFAREAAAYARLSHPAIVKLYDFFSAEGTLVIVLEYIDGLPLNRARVLLRQRGVELDDRSSLFLASRVFAALAAAHAARDPETGEFAPVIHRDVNPSNILVPWDGRAKIADFGIAQVTGVQGDTRSGYIKGTYGYMAPEQVRGETVTQRADVYAGALVLWELLTKRKAIQRGALPEIEVIRAMAEPQLPSLDVLRPDLPAPLRGALKRALEPSADRRAIFADELVAVLRASADLELGRVILADALAPLRPSPVPEDLAKTISLAPANGSTDEERKAAASDTFTDPTMADTVQASTVADATLVTSSPAMTLPLARPPTAPPPAVAARPPHHATTRTAMGLGHTIAMSDAPARPPSKAPPPPSPPVFTRAPPASTMLMPSPPSPASSAPPPFTRAPQGSTMLMPAPAPIRAPTPLPPPAAALPPIAMPPRFEMPSFPMAPGVNDGPVVIERIPRARRSRGVSRGTLGAIVGVSVTALVLTSGLLVLRVRPTTAKPNVAATAPTKAAATVPAKSAATPTIAPTATAVPTVNATPTSTATSAPMTTTVPATSSSGTLDTSSARPNHRVWVDGRVVGQTPGVFSVRCGSRSVRVGSQGSLKTIDIPCGGTVTAR